MHMALHTHAHLTLSVFGLDAVAPIVPLTVNCFTVRFFDSITCRVARFPTTHRCTQVQKENQKGQTENDYRSFPVPFRFSSSSSRPSAPSLSFHLLPACAAYTAG